MSGTCPSCGDEFDYGAYRCDGCGKDLTDVDGTANDETEETRWSA